MAIECFIFESHLVRRIQSFPCVSATMGCCHGNLKMHSLSLPVSRLPSVVAQYSGHVGEILQGKEYSQTAGKDCWLVLFLTEKSTG